MLYSTIAEILKDREIANPNRFLCQNGFTPHTASRLLNNKTKSISHQHLQKLCLLLRCTPNDLYVWQHPANAVKDENQSLHFLVAVTPRPSVIHQLKHLSLQKLREKKQALEEAMQASRSSH